MATYTDAIQKLYVAYFNRPADARGLAYWEGIVTAAKGDTTAVSAAFAASAEYKATYANQVNLQIINKIYQNLFGHDADLPGLEYWNTLLNKKAITIDNVVKAIAEGARTTDLTAYNNKVAAAVAFTTAMDTAAEIVGYEAAKGLELGRTYLSGVTTDASLAAAKAGLANLMKEVDGTGPVLPVQGITVNASSVNASNAATLSNVTGINMSAATSSNLDVDIMTSSTIKVLTLSGGTGGATLTNVAAGVPLTVAGVNTGVSTIKLKSTSGSADTFDLTMNGAAAVDDPLAANVKAGTVVIDGVEKVGIVSGGASHTWNAITLTDSHLQNVTITGAKNLDLRFEGTNGTIDPESGLGGVKLIDGSAASGILNITTENIVADSGGLVIKGGTASDVITLVTSASVNIEAGAGNDAIVSAAAGGTFTGGAGADVFDISAARAVNTTAAGAALVTITDFSSGDKIILASGSTFATSRLTLAATVTNLDLAFAGAVTGVGSVNWFHYGNSTFIVVDANNSGAFNTGDQVVKLMGNLDLSQVQLASNALTMP
jgi:hypothetical protein